MSQQLIAGPYMNNRGIDTLIKGSDLKVNSPYYQNTTLFCLHWELNLDHSQSSPLQTELQ